MVFGYVILGIIIGIWAGSTGENMTLGVLGGLAIGLLLARVMRLERRITELELRRPPVSLGGTEPLPPQPAVREHETPTQEPRPEAAAERHWSDWEPAPTPARRAERPAPALEPSLLEQGIDHVKRWFTQGNVPVKVGVIVSFIGFSFLLKYAIDKELIFLPLELRLIGVDLFGLVLLGIGWRMREKTRTYALSLQGGGLGLQFLTVFAAFRIWSLLPSSLAFGLLVLLTFATGALAVLQNSRTLAILGTVGGFLAPVLASTGEGSHVALFSYYLVLNGAVLGIAWFRAWRGLNLIGFAFTFVIGCLWGYQYYRPELITSIEPFLVVHFLLYNAVAILFAQRQPPDRIGIVDGALVFGTPTIAFALQAALLRDSEYGLAISAAVVAGFYALTAWGLLRRQGQAMRLMTEAYSALAVVFATLAIPLALDARWTAAAWALEGAALVWVGMRQSHHLANLAGTLLVFAAGAAFWEYGWRSGHGLPVLNGNVLGCVLVSLGALFASRQMAEYGGKAFREVYRLAALALFLWGAAWWLGGGLLESLDRPNRFSASHAFLLFLTASTGGGTWLGKRLGWSLLRGSAAVFLPFLALIGLHNFWVNQHALFGLGWLAWLLAWAGQIWLLRDMDKQEQRLASSWHFFTLTFFTLWLANEAWWQVDRALGQAWAEATAATVAGVIALLVWRLRQRPAWPVPLHAATYLDASILVVTLQVLYLAALSVLSPGDTDPAPYLPVLNPYDLALLVAAACAAGSLAALGRETRLGVTPAITAFADGYRLLLSLAFFVMTTAALVRGVHHLAGVSWVWETLFESVIVQTSLSIYWGVLGFAGMIWGARSKRRALWLAGAGFMALVVLKLFAVDLTQTGTVERIISFIGIGLLLLVVGYFAPAPPRASKSGD
jgi:uncharacterized membrane protein